MKSEFTVFFDGKCPLCRREIAWLEKRTSTVDYIDFTQESGKKELLKRGITYQQAMQQIHAFTREGCLITGVDVFSHLYRAAGFPRLARWMKIPFFYALLKKGYRIFAKHRTKLTPNRKD